MNGTTQGFTLIELLIVIAIIGILAVVLLPNLLSAQKRAYDAAAVSCANAFAKGIAIHRVDHPNDTTMPTIANLQSADYGGEKCGTNNGITVTGTLTNPSTYNLDVKHTQGKNIYTVTPNGIDLKAGTTTTN